MTVRFWWGSGLKKVSSGIAITAATNFGSSSVALIAVAGVAAAEIADEKLLPSKARSARSG